MKKKVKPSKLEPIEDAAEEAEEEPIEDAAEEAEEEPLEDEEDDGDDDDEEERSKPALAVTVPQAHISGEESAWKHNQALLEDIREEQRKIKRLLSRNLHPPKLKPQPAAQPVMPPKLETSRLVKPRRFLARLSKSKLKP